MPRRSPGPAWPLLVALVALAAVLTGCSDRPGSEAQAAADAHADTGPTPVRLTDDLGRSIELPSPPQRIATTASFVVEYLLALDHPPVLRPNIPDEEVRPREALSIPALAVDHSVGPNLEQLAAARPDLLITTPTFARFADTVEGSLGVPVAVYQVDDLADVPAKAEALGALIGRPEAGAALAAQLRRQIDAIAPPPAAAPPTVFAIFGTPEASFAVLPDSYLGSMVEHLGGRLITEGLTPGAMSSQFAPFSFEILVQRDPDVILMVHHGPPGEQSAQLRDRPAWASLAAVRHGRVHTLDQRLFVTNPGPRAAEALTQLRAILYPEADGGGRR